MSTTAKLGREIAHLNHTDLLTILFAKQRHSAGLLRFIQSHLLCYNIQILLDLLIYQLLNLFDLLRSHGREMGKVKTESVRSYQGAGLLYMVTEDAAQCLLKQMGCAVVLLGGTAGGLIYL